MSETGPERNLALDREILKYETARLIGSPFKPEPFSPAQGEIFAEAYREQWNHHDAYFNPTGLLLSIVVGIGTIVWISNHIPS